MNTHWAEIQIIIRKLILKISENVNIEQNLYKNSEPSIKIPLFYDLLIVFISYLPYILDFKKPQKITKGQEYNST